MTVTRARVRAIAAAGLTALSLSAICVASASASTTAAVVKAPVIAKGFHFEQKQIRPAGKPKLCLTVNAKVRSTGRTVVLEPCVAGLDSLQLWNGVQTQIRGISAGSISNSASGLCIGWKKGDNLTYVMSCDDVQNIYLTFTENDGTTTITAPYGKNGRLTTTGSMRAPVTWTRNRNPAIQSWVLPKWVPVP